MSGSKNNRGAAILAGTVWMGTTAQHCGQCSIKNTHTKINSGAAGQQMSIRIPRKAKIDLPALNGSSLNMRKHPKMDDFPTH